MDRLRTLASHRRTLAPAVADRSCSFLLRPPPGGRAITAGVLGICAALTACEDHSVIASDGAKAAGRFASVKSEQEAAASRSFCEKSFPSKGEGSRRWVSPPSRPLPRPGPARSEVDEAPLLGPSWTWVNFWASWCGPCVAEMPLLSRWRASLAKDGRFVRFELWSIDGNQRDLEAALDRTFPGEVRWLRGEEELPSLLEALGVDKASAIPIHALVDPNGMLRCVRVGSVGEETYGSVKALLSAI